MSDSGDRAAAAVARASQQSGIIARRDSDLLARIGGEEFALLLPETDLPQAQIMGERLRLEVASTPLMHVSRQIPSTVSTGVAAATRMMTELSHLMKAADGALYDAKRAGRNRVMCSVSPEPSPAIDSVLQT